MAVRFGKNLANGVDIGATSAVVYTVPAGVVRTVVSQARIVNHTAGAITVSIWILQNGESESNEFKALDSESLAANETYLLSEIIGDSLNTGGTIKAIAGSANSVSFSATGTEFTS